MNADAYLRKQGWKGSGHSLDSTGRGIKKPLLIAHKQDQLGLGKKKAAWTTDDQWWMRAFDQSLQSIGTGEESTLSQIRTKGINRGGLYGFFVRGESIAGTIDDSSACATDSSIPPSGASTPLTSASDTEASKPARIVKSEKKRKRTRDECDAVKMEKTAKKSRKEEKRSNKNKPAESTTSKDHGNSEVAVTRKLAKLSIGERRSYEERAALKNQTLHEYVLRRIAKKSEKATPKR